MIFFPGNGRLFFSVVFDSSGCCLEGGGEGGFLFDSALLAKKKFLFSIRFIFCGCEIKQTPQKNNGFNKVER